MGGKTVSESLSGQPQISTRNDKINLLIIGNVVGFIVALIAIKSFIGFLTKHGFKIFGYYRIIAGVAILLIHFFVQKLTII